MEEIQKQLENCKIDKKENIQTESHKGIYCVKNDFTVCQQSSLKTEEYTSICGKSYEKSFETPAECYEDSLLLSTNNLAFSFLELPKDILHIQKFSGIPKLHEKSISFYKVSLEENLGMDIHLYPPSYVTFYPTYDVFQSKILATKILTHQNALKKVIHFDLDVTNYPFSEKWMVGGFIGICIPNLKSVVNEIFELLHISEEEADEQIILEMKGIQWSASRSTVSPRKIKTTRRNIMTWMVDIQSIPPKKALFRLLLEYATDVFDKKILSFLCSKEGQKLFISLCSTKCITLLHLLHAFSSSRPPLEHLLSVLPPLSPRRYSFSNDPSLTPGILQIAATIVKIPDWKNGTRLGLASAYFEKMFNKYINIKNANDTKALSQLTMLIFRGDHKNPLAREAYALGPRIFIGIGVGIAPFRGFVQNRFQNISCFEETWVIQGCRDAKLDELYSGEWGPLNTSENRIVVESQAGKKEHIQDEVRRRGKLIWETVNKENGRIYICGMGASFIKSLDDCLVEIAMKWGGYSHEDAVKKWKEFEDPVIFKYVKEIW
ncbi:hypothetical protein PCANB_001062 [Pneumocystis canis]|nr:hypothetical protein PCANB_001062 [Pneumocystis canis]